MIRHFGLCCLVVLAFSQQVAQSEVIDFEDVIPGYGLKFTSNGFEISMVQFGLTVTDQPELCTPDCASNGTTILQTQHVPDPLTLKHLTGMPFNLVSFDLAELHVATSPIHAEFVQVIGYYADGTTVEASFFLDGIRDGNGPLVDFQYALLPPTFRRLTSVQFFGRRNSGSLNLRAYSLDNIVANPVPEPATLWLAVAGFPCAIPFARRYFSRSGAM